MRDSARLVALAEIAHLFQSTDDADGRLQRALELVARIIPHDRCALLVEHGTDSSVFAVPTPATDRDREDLRAQLRRLLRESEDAKAGSVPTPIPTAAMNHLALPLVANDEEHGIFLVEQRGQAPYDDESLQVLSVVVAQLGTYVAYCRLDAETQARIAAVTRAHQFQQLLVGVVSHDLRNPLSAVVMGTALLSQRISAPRELTTLGRIANSANRGLRIIHDLLDMTREQTTGKLPIAVTTADMSAVVRELVAEAHLAHPERDIDIEGAEGAEQGEFDPDRLAQAVGNLLANAVQHSTRSTPVVVTLRATEDELAISVKNEGVVPPALLPTLFDPLRRGLEDMDPQRHSHGLGLGLYIVAQVARAHGGSIDVRSVEGEGTIFSLRIPRWTASS